VRWSLRCVLSAAAVGLALGGCSAPPGTATGADQSAPSWVATTPALPDTSSAAPSEPPSTSPSAKPEPAPTPTASARSVSYVFPVVGRNSYARTHHDYPATDVITGCGNRFVAVTTGTILAVSRVDTWKPSVNAGATRGGLSVSMLGDDGVRYYGSHLSSIGSAIRPGARVHAGQTLARTGDTGDASACHLHFGISPPCARIGDWWNQRGTVYPWPYLDAWRTGRNKSPAGAVAAWKAQHGCPRKPLTDP
jgi:murein DD-endopeptidase MepM/ murein hydrolase activator NlpD